MRNCDVIIPCYNYARFLRTCVDSVLRQENCSVRALILNDCSTDESLEVARALAKEDTRITVIHHEKNKGHIATYNEGIEWVSADYMLLLSADDLLCDGALDRAIGLMEAHPNVNMVYGRSIKFTDENDPSLKENWVTGSFASSIVSGIEFIKEICSTSATPVQTATAVVRTRIQKNIGGYCPTLPHTGDLEMWLRFAATGDIGFIDAVQALTRMHGSNMRTSYASNEGIRDYLQHDDAFRQFFASDLASAPKIAALAPLAFRSLAERALWTAARSFENGATDSVNQWTTLAKQVWPQIVFTRLWWRQSIKRMVGRRTAHIIAGLKGRVDRSL